MRLLFFLLLTPLCFSDIKSTSGQIKFNVDSDHQIEMTLNGIGLGIGISPSSNLHVEGNMIISDDVFIGGSNGSSNLNVNGTIGFGFHQVSTDTTLGIYSMILADSSSSNIRLTLPKADNYSGRQYCIKKTSSLNTVTIGSDNLIDDSYAYELTSGNTASLEVISDGMQWYILNQSDEVKTSNWAPAFSTTDLWLDASDTSSVLAGGSDNVYQWSDKSGNDRHATQETASDQPLTETVSINGLNAIDFDGSNSEMNLPSLSLTDGTCIIYVFEPDGDTVYSVVGGSVGTTHGHFDRFSDGRTYYEIFRSARPATTVGLESTGVQMLAYNADPASAYNIRLSGNASVSGGSFTATSDYATNLDLLGRAKNNGTKINGKIAEVIVVNSFLSDEHIQRLEGYLAHKWGIESDLPADHPYKSAAP